MSSYKHIEDKLDDQGEQIREIHKELKVMNNILIVNTEQLKIHIAGVAEARRQNDIYKEEMQRRLQPLEEANVVARGYIKLALTLVGLPAGIYYVVQIFKFIAAL
jgi:lipid A disaccharide synthetase